MTYFIGIDIAKYTHVASVITNYGEVLVSPFSFDNSLQGFKLLLSNLESFSKDDSIIGFESTAHYHQNLFSFLTNEGYNCILLNPIVTSKFRNTSIRDVKNDKVDSLNIANYLSFNHSKLNTSSFDNRELITLSKQRFALKQDISKLYIQLTADLDKVFPELKKFFKNTFKTNAAHNLLKKYQTAEQIKKARIDHLTNVISVNSKGYNKDRVTQLKSLASVSIGFHNEAIAMKIRHTIDRIELLDAQINEIDSIIVSLMEHSNHPIMAIPGMGYIQAAYILSAINSIHLFDSPSKVLAFAGLDPKVRQSGNFYAKSTRMSKRGNCLLRYALIWSAHNVVKNSNTMNDYYQKKRSEGKSHYNALGHCAKKLINYIYFIYTNPNVEFILE